MSPQIPNGVPQVSWVELLRSTVLNLKWNIYVWKWCIAAVLVLVRVWAWWALAEAEDWVQWLSSHWEAESYGPMGAELERVYGQVASWTLGVSKALHIRHGIRSSSQPGLKEPEWARKAWLGQGLATQSTAQWFEAQCNWILLDRFAPLKFLRVQCFKTVAVRVICRSIFHSDSARCLWNSEIGFSPLYCNIKVQLVSDLFLKKMFICSFDILPHASNPRPFPLLYDNSGAEVTHDKTCKKVVGLGLSLSAFCRKGKCSISIRISRC